MQEGDLYSEFNKLNPNKVEDIKKFVEEHEKWFQWFPEEVVLDVGCGPGDVTRHCLYPCLPENIKKTVLGVDVSPVMKDIGNKKFSHPDVFFETIDISGKDLDVILEDEKFRDGFTKIFSFHVFHWISDLEMAFRNMYKLLRSQGQVLLTFPVSRQYQRLYKQMQGREPWSSLLKGAHREIPTYFMNGDPTSEFLSIVTKAGFKVVTCKLITTYDEFPSVEALKKLVGSLDIHFSKIPLDMQNQYLDECIETMRQKNLKDLGNGGVAVSEKRIMAFMEK